MIKKLYCISTSVLHEDTFVIDVGWHQPIKEKAAVGPATAASSVRQLAGLELEFTLNSYPNNPSMILPYRTIITGRPVLVSYSFVASIPRLW